MADTENWGRANQRRRTRKDLLQAAARLLKQGRKPSLEDVAAEALVSRATAYRYFPGVEALLVEAALDVDVPTAEDVFSEGAPDDPVSRVLEADRVLAAFIADNEMALRMMLAHSLGRRAEGGDGGPLPVRQNRRTPLIEAALAHAEDAIAPDRFALLKNALALIIGTEAMIVFKDVLQVDDVEAAKVRQWAIRVLVHAALPT